MTKIKIKSDNISKILEKLNSISSKLENASNVLQSNNINVLQDGISKMSNNLNIIGSRSNNTSLITRNQYDHFNEEESRLCSLIDTIEIPVELQNEFDVKQDIKNDILLSKNDGKNIKSDGLSKIVEDNVNYDINRQDLKNVNNIADLEIKEIDDDSIIDRKNLNDIVKDTKLDISLDFENSVEKENLVNINNGLSNDKVAELDDYLVKGVDLHRINNYSSDENNSVNDH